MKKIPLAEVKDHLSELLRDAADEAIIITRHGRPAGVLVGFESEDDWFDYRLENDPHFLDRVARSRAALRDGRGVPWEDVRGEGDPGSREFIVSDRPRATRRAGRKPRGSRLAG